MIIHHQLALIQRDTTFGCYFAIQRQASFALFLQPAFSADTGINTRSEFVCGAGALSDIGVQHAIAVGQHHAAVKSRSGVKIKPGVARQGSGGGQIAVLPERQRRIRRYR